MNPDGHEIPIVEDDQGEGYEEVITPEEALAKRMQEMEKHYRKVLLDSAKNPPFKQMYNNFRRSGKR